MRFTVKQIASLLGGVVEGNEQDEIYQLCKIDEPAPEGSLCFLANKKYENFIYTSGATAVLVSQDFVAKKEIPSSLIRVADPYTAFTQLLVEYQKIIKAQQKQPKGMETPNFVSPDAQIGEDVYIGAFTYIKAGCILGDKVQVHPQSYIGEGAQIGDGTIIYPGVKIYENCIIGKNCILHSGSIIGAEGFGFAPQEDGTYQDIPQLGNVILEDNVSVGANTTIDRATLGSTLIREGVKLDNLVQIAHNVEIGRHTVISAQTGISGSTKIGENCMIGGQVGLSNSIQIAPKTMIAAQSGVNKDIKEEGARIQGYPALPYRQFWKSSVIFRNLPELQRRLELLEEKILNLFPSQK